MKSLIIHLLLVFSLMTSCVSDNDPEPETLIHPGDLLPQFSITMSDGTTVSTTNLAGRPSLICFFNTECPDCRQELPEVNKAYEYCRDNGIDATFLCISRAEEDRDITAYWLKNGLSLPYSPQTTTSVYNLFATSGIPRIYISDPELHVTHTFDDTQMPTANQLIRLLNP